ncbi:MAG: PEP-CTERM sorting domain-containing protein [Roseateles asaccharophilus]|uniref:PEP-CTERM sorting domain-containing protein n=1 Tax=Roseateles asaccharophilus TaxID=582607 RepID=UPI003918A691
MTHATTAFQRFFAPLLLTAAACVTLPAAAQSLYWGTGSGKTESERLKFGTTTSRDVSLGAMSVSTSSTKANSFWVYCLDPLNGANLPSAYTTTSLSNFITSSGSTSYQSLFTNTPYSSTTNYNTGNANTSYSVQSNKTTVLNNLVELYSHAYEDSLENSLKSAAFQYAIWSILGEAEPNYGIDAGGLRAINITNDPNVAAFRTQAAAYLTAVTSAANNAWGNVNNVDLSARTTYTYQVFASSPLGGSQTFLAVSKATGGKVSEPASLALVGIAALGVIAGRRRKSKSAA